MKKNSRFIKVLIAVGVVAASGGASLGITSLVSANTSSASEVVAVTADVKTMHAGKRGVNSEAMAELFGMTQDELHDALHSGKSLATIAEEKNVELSKVTDLLVSEFSAHLDEEVAAGEHTREEADAKLAEFKANVDQMVTMTPPVRGEGQRGGKGHGPKIGAGSEAMATLLGITQDELHEALHSGKSLATIAEEKNVELSKVTDLLVSELSAHLDEEVASGEHTREEADAKLAEFKANVDQMVTMTPPVRGEGQRGGKGHGGMGRGGHGGGRHDHGEMNGPTDQLQDLEGNGTALNA